MIQVSGGHQEVSQPQGGSEPVVRVSQQITDNSTTLADCVEAFLSTSPSRNRVVSQRL